MAGMRKIKTILDPPLVVIDIFVGLLKRYDYATLAALLILDMVSSVGEALGTAIGSLITFFTGGLAAPLTIAMVGAFDVGLMILVFIITYLFEAHIFGKKKQTVALGMAFMASLFFLFPLPILTISIITLRVGVDVVGMLLSGGRKAAEVAQIAGKTLPAVVAVGGFFALLVAAAFSVLFVLPVFNVQLLSAADGTVITAPAEPDAWSVTAFALIPSMLAGVATTMINKKLKI